VEEYRDAEGVTPMMDVDVQGAARKIDAMKRFNDEIWKGVQRGVKEATELVSRDARTRVPQMGLVSLSGSGGWGKWTEAKSGRDLSYDKSKFVIKTGFRSRVNRGFREVSGRTYIDSNNAAVAIFLLAGSVNKSGHRFNRAINAQQGGEVGARGQGLWPRILTPARNAKGPEASKEIGRIIEQAIREFETA
jgi:hypothetical protein